MGDGHERVPDDPPVPRRRAELRALLEVSALSGLVVAQPLLDVIGRSPDFLLFHGAGSGEILLLVAVLTVLPPLALWGLGSLTGLVGRRLRDGVHTLTLGALLAALAVQVGKHLSPLRGVPLILVAAGAATIGLYAYHRWRASGQVLRFAAVGSPVFALLFVFASPTSALVLPAAGSGPRASGGGADRPPVVLLVLDELPLVSLLDADGRIDARRFPQLARLADDATWYRNATAVSGSTPYALPAMLTGRYPAGEAPPHHARYPDNLFTLLDGVYELRVSESISQLCPPARCGSTSPRDGFSGLLRDTAALLVQMLSPVETVRDRTADYRESTRREAGRAKVSESAAEVPTDSKFRWDALGHNQPVRFSTFLAGLRPADRPTLHFLHLLLPHTPWTYLPSGMRYEPPTDLVNDGDGWVSLAHERYQAQLAYTDRLVGELVRRLTETGLYDEALVVVTADHGLSFTPGAQGRETAQARRAPGEVLWVPLLVKEPGQRTGRIDDRNIEQVDLLPTVADRLDIAVPWRTDGRSALDRPRARQDKVFHGEPGEPMTVPGETFQRVLSGAARPALPAPPRPDLVGRATAELSVSDGASARVVDREAFDRVDPAGGVVPALVCGTVSESVPNGAPVAVALNGRIAAVVRLVDPDGAGRRFCALIGDDSLFTAGRNRLELFEVAGGDTLRRLRL
ncbi:MAG TPA: sulfatase-like hydrolase/transferase [Micromonosporaceae bacterium]